MSPIRLLGLAIVASITLVACSPDKIGSSSQSGGNSISQNGRVIEGAVAPDFNLESFVGNQVNLASFQGKAVFVDFWAAWCPFCLEELPEIEKISKEFEGNLVVLGVHRTETESIDQGKKFASERGVTYQLLKDSDGSIYKAYTGGRNFMPTAAFINKEGKIIKILYGPKTEEQMRQYVREALGQTN